MKEKEIPYKFKIPNTLDKDGKYTHVSELIVKDKVVPDKPITLDANKYPDIFKVANKDGEYFNGSIVDKGTRHAATGSTDRNGTVTINHHTGGTMYFTITSSRKWNKGMPKTIGTISYWKYSIISVPVLKIK